jgi:uncharacterized protein YoxC
MSESFLKNVVLACSEQGDVADLREKVLQLCQEQQSFSNKVSSASEKSNDPIHTTGAAGMSFVIFSLFFI